VSVDAKYPLPSDVEERTKALRELWQESRTIGECVVCAKYVGQDARFGEFVHHFASHIDVSKCEDVIVWFSYGPYQMKLIATTKKCAICAFAGPLPSIQQGILKRSIFLPETAKLDEYNRLNKEIGKLHKKVAEMRKRQESIRKKLKRRFPETLLEEL